MHRIFKLYANCPPHVIGGEVFVATLIVSGAFWMPWLMEGLVFVFTGHRTGF